MRTMKRSFPSFFVDDVPATVDFYERAFGAVLDHAHDDGSYAELRLGDLMLGLCAATEARRHLPVEFHPADVTEPPGAFELYLEVDDADEAARRASEAGAALLAPPVNKPWGNRVAYLRDPNGFTVEVASRLAP